MNKILHSDFRKVWEPGMLVFQISRAVLFNAMAPCRYRELLSPYWLSHNTQHGQTFSGWQCCCDDPPPSTLHPNWQHITVCEPTSCSSLHEPGASKDTTAASRVWALACCPNQVPKKSKLTETSRSALNSGQPRYLQIRIFTGVGKSTPDPCGPPCSTTASNRLWLRWMFRF